MFQATDVYNPGPKVDGDPEKPKGWPPTNPHTGLKDFRYPFNPPKSGIQLVAEQLPKARPMYDYLKYPQKMVPLPGLGYGEQPPSHLSDPLGLDGTCFAIRDAKGRLWQCAFHRKWFYAFEDTPSIPLDGTYVLVRSNEKEPDNAVPARWPTIWLGDEFRSFQATTFKVRGPNGIDHWYGVSEVKGSDNKKTPEELGFFTLYQVNECSLPKPPQPEPPKPQPSSSSSSKPDMNPKLVNLSSEFVKGESGDVTLDTDGMGGITDVLFQTWSNTSGEIEAVHLERYAPYVYPASALRNVSNGDASVQALIRDSDSNILKIVSKDVKFIDKESSSSSSQPTPEPPLPPTEPDPSKEELLKEMIGHVHATGRHATSALATLSKLDEAMKQVSGDPAELAVVLDALPQLVEEAISLIGKARTENSAVNTIAKKVMK